jgi:putative transposase
VHAGVVVSASDRAGRERLLRYCARPPLSLERLTLLRDGRIAYAIRKSWTSETHRVMQPVQFLARLAALISPPRHPLIRFYGVFAPHSSWRKKVVPPRSSCDGEGARACRLASSASSSTVALTATLPPARPRSVASSTGRPCTGAAPACSAVVGPRTRGSARTSRAVSAHRLGRAPEEDLRRGCPCVSMWRAPPVHRAHPRRGARLRNPRPLGPAVPCTAGGQGESPRLGRATARRRVSPPAAVTPAPPSA